MGRVVLGMTVSLDGYINDGNGSVERLYGDLAEYTGTEAGQEAIRTTGAVVMGRRTYDMGEGDWTGYEFQVPIFVVTHRAPEAMPKGTNEHLTFTFVSDGIESAVVAAKSAAGAKDVTVVGGAQVIRECLRFGLGDELHIDVMPVLFGAGARLFDGIRDGEVVLDTIGVARAGPRTSIKFRIGS